MFELDELNLVLDESCEHCRGLFKKIQKLERECGKRVGSMNSKGKLWVAVVVSPEYDHNHRISCWHIQSVREAREVGP